MSEEVKYPIYQFSAKYIINYKKFYPEYKNLYLGLPEGREWSSQSFSKIYIKEQENYEMDLFNLEWWNLYRKKKLRGLNLELVFFSWELKEHEAFNLTWFQHETIDIGQSDSEVLNSFRDFVDRKLSQNRQYQSETGLNKYCLMGAEDRWRWKDPCRCEHCKKLGLIRIGH